MKNRSPQLFLAVGMLLAVSMLFSLSMAFAADSSYPSKPVRLIVPFAPGGSNDIIGRQIAAQLTERLGKQVIVENRGGAGAVIGMEMVAKSEPDGYTLLLSGNAYTIAPSLHQNLPYDPAKSLIPIARLGTGPAVLTVYPNLPVNSVKELIAYAKQNPGKLVCASVGVGTFNHLGAELFKIMAGVDFKIVQFKGGGPATTDHLGGHAQIMFGSLTQAIPHIKSGKLKAFGTGGSKRNAALPDVPTIAEAGVPGYESTIWWGIHAPAGTPKPIGERLQKELKAILSAPETEKMFQDQGADTDYLGSAEFGKFIETETVKWTRVIKESNIKAN
jgi:tripartite-type tricarboxylate transporter receptor subunit TctC